jgi:hypothetical protein
MKHGCGTERGGWGMQEGQEGATLHQEPECTNDKKTSVLKEEGAQEDRETEAGNK